MSHLLRVPLSTVAVLVVALPAQEPPEPIEAVAKRVKGGGELIAMQWRRDDAGRLQTCPKGSADWQPLVADDFRETFETTGSVGWLMMWMHGENDVLGMTDGERHLGRVGLGTADVELRTFLATPLPAGADARHPAALDRMIVIDLLRRRGVRNAAPELRAVAQRDGVPDALRRRAQDALAAVEGGTRPARPQLDPATLPLPVAADGYLVFDNRRIPDTSRLADLGRRMGLAASLKVLQLLKAPRPADFLIGQTESDAIGEIAFEFVRRYGNHRIDQACIAMLWQPQNDSPAGLCVHAVGEFDVATAKKVMPDLLDTGLELKATESALSGKSEQGAFELAAAHFTAAHATMRGKPRPELAQQLLAMGNAGIHIVVPANSKAWLGIAALELPPAQGGEIAVTFVPEFSVRIAITARDEDAAEAWVARAKVLLEQYVPALEGYFTAGGASPDPALADVLAAVNAVALRAEGKVATAELTGKTFGWATLEALLEGPMR